MGVAGRLLLASLSLVACQPTIPPVDQQIAKNACRDAARTLSIIGDGRSVPSCERALTDAGVESVDGATDAILAAWRADGCLPKNGSINNDAEVVVSGAIERAAAYFGK